MADVGVGVGAAGGWTDGAGAGEAAGGVVEVTALVVGVPVVDVAESVAGCTPASAGGSAAR
jgi:hypothetical protein